MLPFVSGGRKPTRHSIHNNSAALNGYKRADGLQFGKSRLLRSSHLQVCISPSLTTRPEAKFATTDLYFWAA